MSVRGAGARERKCHGRRCVCSESLIPISTFCYDRTGQCSSPFDILLKARYCYWLVDEQRMPIEYPFQSPALRTTSTIITSWTMGDKRSASLGLDNEKVMSTDYIRKRQRTHPESSSWSSGGGNMNKKFITLYFIIGLLATGKYLYSVLTAFSGEMPLSSAVCPF